MELLKLKVTPVDFKNRIYILIKYGITHSVNSPCIYETMYLIIDIDKKNAEGLIGVEEALAHYSSIKDACEDFFLLPDEVKKKAYENSDGNIISLLKNPIIKWFSWGISPEGYQFWYNWEKTINQRLSEEIKVSKKFDEWYTTSPIEPIPIDTHNALYEAFEKCRKDYAELIEDNLKLYNKEDYESRLQKQKADISGRDGAKPIRLHGGKHQVRVTKFSLSYKKVSGRS